MKYKIILSPYTDEPCGIIKDNTSIPLNLDNRHYQEMLDAIIKQGTDCFEGEIPEKIQTDANAKAAAKSG